MINEFQTLFEARERKFQQEKLFRGESVDLVAKITTDGVPDSLDGYTAEGYYQPIDYVGTDNESVFYAVNAEIIDGKVIVHWTYDKDFGKNAYSIWALLTKSGEQSYPVCWRLALTHSPSYPPGETPDPIPQTLDFSKYELLNAPWLELSSAEAMSAAIEEDIGEVQNALSDYLPLSGGTVSGHVHITSAPDTYSELIVGRGDETEGQIIIHDNDIVSYPIDGGEDIYRFPKDRSGTLVVDGDLTGYATKSEVAEDIDALSDEYEPKGAEQRAKGYTDGKVAEVSGSLSNYIEKVDGAAEGLVAETLTANVFHAPGITADETTDGVQIEADNVRTTSFTAGHPYGGSGEYGIDIDNGSTTVIRASEMTVDNMTMKGTITFSDDSTLSSTNDLATKTELTAYASTSYADYISGEVDQTKSDLLVASTHIDELSNSLSGTQTQMAIYDGKFSIPETVVEFRDGNIQLLDLTGIVTFDALSAALPPLQSSQFGHLSSQVYAITFGKNVEAVNITPSKAYNTNGIVTITDDDATVSAKSLYFQGRFRDCQHVELPPECYSYGFYMGGNILSVDGLSTQGNLLIENIEFKKIISYLYAFAFSGMHSLRSITFSYAPFLQIEPHIIDYCESLELIDLREIETISYVVKTMKVGPRLKQVVFPPTIENVNPNLKVIVSDANYTALMGNSVWSTWHPYLVKASDWEYIRHSELSAYATTESLSDYATTDDLTAYSTTDYLSTSISSAISSIPYETWTFTLSDDTEVTKEVLVK